ncbi:MAG: hypothetical protein ACXVBW_04270, partial [Bdellovibrionota bacterium]
QKSRGSCSIPWKKNFQGISSCIDFYEVTPEVAKAGCRYQASTEPCPTSNTLLTCRLEKTKAGLMVTRYYQAPKSGPEAKVKAYDEIMAKNGCKAPWTACSEKR